MEFYIKQYFNIAGKRPTKRRSNVRKKLWTTEETKAIEVLFKNFLRKKITPNTKEIRTALKYDAKRGGKLASCDPIRLKKKISWMNNRHKHVLTHAEQCN